jgi:uncharacterized protein (DUF952 family)
VIYKILRAAEWQRFVSFGRFEGGPADRQDGFIHFSGAHQVSATLLRRYAGEADLVLLAVDASRVGAHLRWEPSRSGELFPHLYASLYLNDVAEAHPLAVSVDGSHVFQPPIVSDKSCHTSTETIRPASLQQPCG